QQAQASQDDLTAAERRDLTNWLGLNSTALKARRDGASQLRQADETLRQGRPQHALMLLKSIAPNQQFLTPGEKQRHSHLTAKVMRSEASATSSMPAGNAANVAQARSKLKQAHMLMARGNYDAAQALAHEAEGLGAQLQAGEDTPQRVLEDISHARNSTVAS